MKVKDLIDQLKKYDKNSEVLFTMADGCCGELEFLELYDGVLDCWEKTQYSEEQVIFDFKSLWFMDTCITGGRARDAALKHKKSVYGENWKPGDPNKFIKERKND